MMSFTKGNFLARVGLALLGRLLCLLQPYTSPQTHQKLTKNSPLGQAKLIIRFMFLPACFFASTTKFSFYESLHRMYFQIFSLLYYNFHYCINEVFGRMNNENDRPPAYYFENLETGI